MVEHVVVGTGTHGTRFLDKDWPITDGLIAGTTSQKGHKEKLDYEESYVRREDTKGID